MLIILEGCDGTGKTTLANMLKPLLGAEIVHCTTKTPNTYEFFDSIIYAARNKNIIVDRFCYGQFVYQDEEDRPLGMMKLGEFTGEEKCVESSWEALTRLEMGMLHTDVKLIYCYADTETIYERLAKRGEKSALPVTRILQEYKELWKRTLIQPIYFKT